ncbi:hypothetical protein EMGBS6_14370 [Opitutia bacterium]|nr:hypothetical protein EMGBS6_14370 [Opitutae bacterium]
MKHLPLLLLAALGFAAEDAPRPNVRPEGPTPEGRSNPRLPVPLSPDEQKRLREAMEKANQDPSVKEANEQAAKAQQAAAEAQKKAREATDEAARKADPSVAPILEKIRKAMEQRQPGQPGRQPEAKPASEAPRQREGGNRQPNAEPGRSREGNPQPEAKPRGEAPRQREGSREEPTNRSAQLPGLSPDEQRRVREAMAKANAEPAVREAREAAAAAQRKAMEIAEDAARKADPSLTPLFEKMHKAGEAQRGRKQPE